MAKRKRTVRRRKTMRNTAPKVLIPEPRAKTSSCGCSRGLGWLFIILGILYIGHDLGAFQWWTISWWSILFLIGGWLILKK